MPSPIQATSARPVVAPAPRPSASRDVAPTPRSALDSLTLSKPAMTAARTLRPAHNGGWDDLASLVPVMVFSPLASVVAAGLGFAVAGPVGAAVGAIAGGSALGGMLGIKNLVHHFRHRAKNEDTDDGFNLGLAGKLLVAPGTTLLGAGAGFLAAGPLGAAVGAVIGSAGMMLVGLVKRAFEREAPTDA